MALARVVGADQLQNYITDEITFKDKISGAIQVEALSNPRDFTQRWNRFLGESVREFFEPVNNLDNNPVYRTFKRYVDDLGVPDFERNKLYADFTQKIIDEFVKNVIKEDVAGMAAKKLETKRLPVI